MDSSDERDLLESVGSGNEAAFWRLWREHTPHLYEICARITGATDADDALSRSMLLARAKLPSYAGEILNLEAWLTRLAGNVCRDMLREQRRPFAVSLDDDPSGNGNGSATHIPGQQLSPEQEYVQIEIRTRVTAAIAALHPRLRSAATLYFLEDLSYPVIAQQLGITNENARKRVQQARAALREELYELWS